VWKSNWIGEEPTLDKIMRETEEEKISPFVWVSYPFSFCHLIYWHLTLAQTRINGGFTLKPWGQNQKVKKVKVKLHLQSKIGTTILNSFITSLIGWVVFLLMFHAWDWEYLV
jgi:hypothetical protein